MRLTIRSKSRSRVLAAAGLALVLAGRPADVPAGEIGFTEDFALSDDRAKALEQLLPGTEEYYFYHCLHAQNTGRLDEVEKLLKTWIDRHGRTGRVVEMENRQALLRYEGQPRKSLDFIRERLGLKLDHRRRVLGEAPKLPVRLDPKVIARDALARRALARHRGTLDGFEDRALEWAAGLDLDPDRRRNLLARLQLPDIPNLPELITADLAYKKSRGFGSLKIHRQLLLSQLKECLKLKPDLLNQSSFVNAYVPKLWPSDDVDWRSDTKAREAYLQRLWAFVSRLNSSHNSLKAHVLYHRLAHDRALGTYDKDRFMAYLRLPRNAPYLSRDYMKLQDNRRFSANLGTNYRSITRLPAVGNDEPLVRSYLAHFFLTETTTKPYETYLDDSYVKHLFAETKITAGLGDMETWYSMLPPAMYQALKDRVDLDFAPTNKTTFGADEPAALDLYVKGVKTLIVKVFEVNTVNFYRENLRELTTAIDLDGLVANKETTYTYDEPALRRVKRHFEFPSLAKRGTYVVEFIGGGKSSRALIRKGRLNFLVRTSVAGQVFTVLDESNRKLSGAKLWISGHEYLPDKEGVITVPFSNQPGRRPVVLVDGSFASLDFFQHESENYRLAAGIHVDREALLAGSKARVVVRPSLTLNGVPVVLSILEDTALTITSTDREGVNTTSEVKDFKLHGNREAPYEFKVPSNLARISFVLKARVQNMSQGKKLDLRAGRSFSLNGIDGTEKIEDLHLSHAGGKYVLDLLGKTGEVLPHRPVVVTLKHQDFRDTIDASLQTDKRGRVTLGALDAIEWIRAKGPEGTQFMWPVARDLCGRPASIHARVGETILVPAMGPAVRPLRSEFLLLETRGGTYLRDRFEALSMRDGYLRIEDLPAGDYELFLKREGRKITVRITQGEEREGYVLSPYRRLEKTSPHPLQITSVSADEKTLTIRLAGTSKFTRVHVAATRFVPEFHAYGDLDVVEPPPPYVITLPAAESQYVTGRDIGDEYRYILERKYATIHPGNMLTRPSLILNPWAVRSTETGRQEAKGGEAFKKASKPKGRFGGRGLKREAGGEAAPGAGGFSSLDFLAEPSALLLNLRPDAGGTVTVERARLGAHHELHVVAVSPEETVYREVSLPEAAGKFKDLRLANSLDSKKHYTEQKEISFVKKDGTFVVGDITTSDFEVYDTLAKAYRLLATISGNRTLAEFGFIIEWPKLKSDEKREKYAKYACHELNFFLHEKDPEFFRDVVRPYIENKYHKTFLDRWLLGEDLGQYLDPWAFEQLNIVEKVLLARRVAAEREGIERQVSDLFDLVPPDVELFNRLFRTALKGRALESADAYGLEKAKRAALADKLSEVAGKAATRNRPVTTHSLAAIVREPAAPATFLPPAAAEGKRKKLAVEQLRAGELKKAQRGLGVGGGAAGAYGARYKADLGRRLAERQLYRKLEKTKEWAENNYYHLPVEKQTAALITVNGFWKDFAAHEEPAPFFSPRFAEASRSFPEMMLALAVLDLPFEAAKHASKVDKAQFTLRAASPLIVYHKQIKDARKSGEKTPILVTQNYYRFGERYVHVGNERRDKFITDEFLVHVVYGCQVVITNPTSAVQKLDVLLQIPRGALPVKGGLPTRSLSVRLEPYRTWTADYFFYFPAAGLMPHFPVHVAQNGKLLAFAEPAELKVVESPSSVDTTSWDYISQNGTGDQVIDFLKAANLGRVPLDRIAWRMRDEAFFGRTLALLRKRHVYNGTLWSYGFLHGATGAVREYLEHADNFVRRCGAAMDSKLLVIDPVQRKTYQHLEYWPLVNARAHRLGKTRTILNNRFHQQYIRWLNILCYRPSLDDGDLMSAACYLLLQDRVEDAMKFFGRVRPAKLDSRIQYDYCDTYLSFYSEDLRRARSTAARYAKYPVKRWRDLFAGALSQLDEIEGKASGPGVTDEEDRTQQQTRLAATEPSFDIALKKDKVEIDYQNLDAVEVSYYLMDIELLFSRNPFVGQYSGQFSYIRPNARETVRLDAKKTKHAFALPRKYLSANVLVEVRGGGMKKTLTHFSGAMSVQVIRNYAQVKVTRTGTRKPLAAVYVKVYARMKGGQVRFYKDGYTDLRGRFDYGSLSTNELDHVERFALLLLSDKHGAVVKEAPPPAR